MASTNTNNQIVNDAMETPPAAIDENLEGVRRFKASDYEGAVESFTAAIAIDPGFEAGYRCRAEALRRLGRGREANADLNMAEPIKLAWQRKAAEDSAVKGGISIPFVATALPVVTLSLISAARAAVLVWPAAPVASFYVFWVLAATASLVGLATAVLFALARREHVAREITAGLGVGFCALAATWTLHLALPLADFS